MMTVSTPDSPTTQVQAGAQVNINIGQVQISGMPKAPGNTARFTQHIQTALQNALSRPGLGTRDTIDIPQLIVHLPHNASEIQIAEALSRAISQKMDTSRYVTTGTGG